MSEATKNEDLIAALLTTQDEARDTVMGAVISTGAPGGCRVTFSSDGFKEIHEAGCGHVPIIREAQQISESDRPVSQRAWVSAIKANSALIDRLENAEAERDAANSAIERVRANHKVATTNLINKRCACGEIKPCSTDTALDGAPEPDRLSIPTPIVPFGPEGVPPTVATASYLIEVVKKLDFGYSNVGGSNVTATVRKLLVDTAEALRGLPVEGEKP